MNYKDIYKHWQDVFTQRGETENITILNELAKNEQALEDSFYKDLEFGTAGLRGILGLGTNKMNIYTVGKASQGFAQYINSKFKTPSIAISYDSRNMSKEFAELSARVMAANNVKVYLFEKLAPTPTLSYAVRELACSAGINITASHNPSEYNGYKAYDETGCQISTELADIISAEISKVDIFEDVKTIDLDKALKSGLVEYLKDDFVDKFVDEVLKLRLTNENLHDLNITYTPLNGAGRYSVLRVFDKMGIKNIHTVAEQLIPDGNFPTCKYPNPEIEDALKLGIELMFKSNSDILIATDPDCDRVGTIVPRKDGSYRVISGNELGILLIDYICQKRIAENNMPKNAVAIRSIVSSSLFDKVAENFNVRVHKVLTGFKYIGEYLNSLEKSANENEFIFSFEESCGYLSGTHARDKDAVNASMLVAELVAFHKKNNKNLEDALIDIYEKYGYFIDKVQSFEFKGKQGMETMQKLMNDLRKTPIQNLGNKEISLWLDYQTSDIRDKGGNITKIENIPQSNILEYKLGELGSVIIRPSGTEPKLKVYFSIKNDTLAMAEKSYAELSESIKEIISEY